MEGNWKREVKEKGGREKEGKGKGVKKWKIKGS